MTTITNFGKSPYLAGDNTRDWVEAVGRKNGVLTPGLVLRYATDTNYLMSVNRHLYGTANSTQQTKAVFNIGLPTERVPGVMAWNVTETDAITQTASVDILNCLPISQTNTALSVALPAEPHTSTVLYNYIADSLGVVQQVTGNVAGVNTYVENQTDSHGYAYREENVKYRTFVGHTMSVVSSAGFPRPEVTAGGDADGLDIGSAWPSHAQGVGSYFCLVGGVEIVRVVALSGNVFTIPVGGRNLQDPGNVVPGWPIGTSVQLLGFGPYTGDWTGMGYLSVDDETPQKALLRPGTCLTSYEGWGEITGPLSHDGGANYAFTGYWFVSGCEPSMGDDGAPKIRIDLKSAGNMYEAQKITPDLLRRAKTQFGQWDVGNRTLWQAAGATRNIPGDWVDYDSWDPSAPASYPLAIKIELAQHKEFFNHMIETVNGTQCLICRQEAAEWSKTHSSSGTNALLENRAIGKHIYQNSIRVLHPLMTYIRLMGTLAAAAWDHPAYGTELSQAFSKIPNQLFTNIMSLTKANGDPNGLIFNGQIELDLEHSDTEFDWFSPTYTDLSVKTRRTELTCPFEAAYDKTPFSQPMQEVADANGCNFWVTRKGEPVFVPRLFNYRPFGLGGQWTQSYGGSISQYSNSLAADDMLTQVWVTATSAFDSTLTVLGGGTGYDGGKLINYSALGGNRKGLALTSGVQKVDTITIDNQVLGLDWNTTPAAWGTVQSTAGDGTQIINALPTLYDGSPTIDINDNGKHPEAVKRLQRIANFFLLRQYILPQVNSNGTLLGYMDVDGKFGTLLKNCIHAIQVLTGDSHTDGVYTRSTYQAIATWLSTNQHYIMFDIFWYVRYAPDDGWQKYLSAITGVPIKLGTQSVSDGSGQDAIYAVDDTGTQSEVGAWTKTFSKHVVQVANRAVDDSMNKAMVRSIASNIADPRIQPGDVIWATVPGFVALSPRAPHTNGVYVTSISRSMDLQQATYTSTYSGYRFIGANQQGLSQGDIDAGYASIHG